MTVWCLELDLAVAVARALRFSIVFYILDYGKVESIGKIKW